jgi:hypothetical protein
VKGSKNTITNNIASSTSATSVFYTSNVYSSTSFNLVFKNNLLFSSTGAFLYFPTAKNITETIDSNKYLRPYNLPANFLMASTTQPGLSEWVAYSGYDAHSSVSLPYGITSTSPTIFTNPTQADSTITLTGGYYDENGVGYAGTMVLTPYQGKMLFPSIYVAPTPIRNLTFKSVIRL